MIWVMIEPPTLSEIQPPTGARQRANEGADPGVGQYSRRIRIRCRVLHGHPLRSGTWLTPKITFIESGRAIEKTDERAEGDDVEDGPATRYVYYGKWRTAWPRLLSSHRRAASFITMRARIMSSGMGHPHIEQTHPGGCRKVQVEHEDRRREGQCIQIGDLGEGDDRIAGIGRDRFSGCSCRTSTVPIAAPVTAPKRKPAF